MGLYGGESFFKALLLRKGPRKVEAALVLIQFPKCKHSFALPSTETVRIVWLLILTHVSNVIMLKGQKGISTFGAL